MIIDKKNIKHNFITLIKNNINIEFSLINICKAQKSYKIRVGEESYTLFEIFRKIRKIQKKILNIYKKWKHLFYKNEIIAILYIYQI